MTIKRRRFALAAASTAMAAPALTGPALIGSARGQDIASIVLRSNRATYRLVTMATGLVQPWSIAFLPDSRLLITERPGRLRIFANGSLSRAAVSGVPEVYASGQGGLLDVCLHPNFAQNKLIYLSYAGGAGSEVATTVARAEWTEGGLRNVSVIFRGSPVAGGLHFGSRIAFDRAGLMYVTCGERYQMKRAQDLNDLAGKVIRLKDDGSVPPDNPFVGKPGARPEIFTWGHRNPQGLTIHPETGRIWEVEHGPRGGDELNLLKPGANYGWPLATYGIDYNGSIISPNKTLPGMEDPVRYWVPSISPCGLVFYSGDKFPGWKGSLFTGALSSFALYRIELDGEKWRSEELLVEGRLPYIRDVRQGPDGLLYLVTQSENGSLYRLEPV